MAVTMFYRRARRTKPGTIGKLESQVVRPSQTPLRDWQIDYSAAFLNGVSRQQQPDPGAHAGERVLTNARVVLGDAVISGTVRIAGGYIADISTGRTGLASAIDLQGDFLLPGLVDVHTDHLERHLQPRPGVVWPSVQALLAHDRQLAGAGITTALDSLCVGDRDNGTAGRPDIVIEVLQAIERAQADALLKVDHLLHLRCEVSAEGIVESLAGLIDDPLVRLVSLMDHTPGQRQWADLSSWRRHQRRNNLSEGELEAIFSRRASRGAALAAGARAQVAEMCRQRRLPLASHDDATAGHVQDADALGVAISEFPTTVVAAKAARAAGMRVIMGAPNVVLNGSHAGNVSARELASAGLVDGLASDYVPMSLMQACFICHHVLGMPLPQAAAAVSAGPAAMVGLHDRGVIAPGRRADLVRVKSYDSVPVVCGVWRRGEQIL